MRKALVIVVLIAILAIPRAAAAFAYDVSITHAAIAFTPAAFFLNDRVRIYATVKNVGDRDVSGMVFFSENGTAVGQPQYFSARARAAEEDVWVEWQPAVEGNRQIFVRVVTEPETRDENPSNNEMIVPLFIDRDTDGDRIGDRDDADDDNDGLPDAWELERGLNPKDARDALLDPDGDGRTTIEEYRAGTDPFKKESRIMNNELRDPTPAQVIVPPQPKQPVLTEIKIATQPKKTATTTTVAARPPAPAPDARAENVGVVSATVDVGNAQPNAPAPASPTSSRESRRSDDEMRRLLGEGAPRWQSSIPWIAGVIAFASLIAIVFLVVRARRNRQE